MIAASLIASSAKSKSSSTHVHQQNKKSQNPSMFQFVPTYGARSDPAGTDGELHWLIPEK